MENKYILIKSIFAGTSYRTSYGIALVNECDGITVILQSILDVSPNKSYMEELVEHCNRLQLSPIHLVDVVSNFLAAI